MNTRNHFTFAELEQWLDQNHVTEIECLIPDLTGVARGKILPRAKFTQERGMLTLHARIADRLRDVDAIAAIKARLHEKFGIDHATV